MLRKLFKAAAGPDEKMKADELEALIRRLSASNNQHDGTLNAQELFRRWDTDADGYMSFDEFLSLYASVFVKKGSSADVPRRCKMKCTKQVPELIQKMFLKMADSEGLVELDSLRDLVRRVTGLSEAGSIKGTCSVDKILTKYDTDGSGKMSQGEFAVLYNEMFLREQISG